MKAKPTGVWPTPSYDEREQPHFLFLLTQPYAGSTAIARLLNTSHRTAFLQERGEAQWLVPGLSAPERWDPGMPVEYESVRAVWLSTFQRLRRLTQTTDVIIEKSPPNMTRIEALSSRFRDHSMLASNRDPYAQCSSVFHRRGKQRLGDADRVRHLRKFAARWLTRSRALREIVERLGIPLLTYEQVCRDPGSLTERAPLPDGVTETMDPDATLRVKDYPPQPITNQNDRQISRLTDREAEALTAVLRHDRDLLRYFGYDLRE